jgi:excisionase family DNA binding protein
MHTTRQVKPNLADLTDVKTIAAELRVTRRFIENLIASGDLPAYRIGKRMLRVRRSDVEALLQRVPTRGAA